MNLSFAAHLNDEMIQYRVHKKCKWSIIWKIYICVLKDNQSLVDLKLSGNEFKLIGCATEKSSSSSLGSRCVPWLGEGLSMLSPSYPVLCFPLNISLNIRNLFSRIKRNKTRNIGKYDKVVRIVTKIKVTCSGHAISTTIGELSSQFEEFLAARSLFDSDHDHI